MKIFTLFEKPLFARAIGRGLRSGLRPTVWRTARLAAWLIAGLAAAGAVHAQDFPSRPIHLVVPIGPGGALDGLARAIGPRLSEAIGQPVVIENRFVGGGIIAINQLAKAEPDGYTLLMIFDSFVTNRWLYKSVQYDPEKDFAPISLISLTPQVLLLHPGVGSRNMKEFLTLVRSSGAGMDFATAGAATSSRLSLELFKQTANLDLTAVHYRGGNKAIIDLLGGQVKGMLISISVAIPYVKTGKLTAIGVSATKRAPLLPEVPPISDTFPGFEAQGWAGVLAPAATPRPVIEYLNAALRKTLARADVRGQLENRGYEVVASTPEAFGEWVRTESSKWARIIREQKITID